MLEPATGRSVSKKLVLIVRNVHIMQHFFLEWNLHSYNWLIEIGFGLWANYTFYSEM